MLNSLLQTSIFKKYTSITLRYFTKPIIQPSSTKFKMIHLTSDNIDNSLIETKEKEEYIKPEPINDIDSQLLLDQALNTRRYTNRKKLLDKSIGYDGEYMETPFSMDSTNTLATIELKDVDGKIEDADELRKIKRQKKKEKYILKPVAESELIEFFIRSSGPGGQSVNKTSSCVLLKHLPTGTQIKCQITRSLQQNRKLARRIMAEKLDELVNGENGIKGIISAKIAKQSDRRRRRRLQNLKEAEAKKLEASKNPASEVEVDEIIPPKKVIAKEPVKTVPRPPRPSMPKPKTGTYKSNKGKMVVKVETKKPAYIPEPELTPKKVRKQKKDKFDSRDKVDVEVFDASSGKNNNIISQTPIIVENDNVVQVKPELIKEADQLLDKLLKF